MSTYSEHEQRKLDQESGAELDRRAKAKHTPGPWRVTREWGSLKYSRQFGVEAPTREGPGFPTPSATGYYAMAYPPPHGHDPESRATQEANARLIAAAPELAEALQSLTAWWDADHGDEGIGDVVAQARAALAKAGVS